jgi:hypothetical protein
LVIKRLTAPLENTPFTANSAQSAVSRAQSAVSRAFNWSGFVSPSANFSPWDKERICALTPKVKFAEGAPENKDKVRKMRLSVTVLTTIRRVFEAGLKHAT